jgi:hypothetical protein
MATNHNGQRVSAAGAVVCLVVVATILGNRPVHSANRTVQSSAFLVDQNGNKLSSVFAGLKANENIARNPEVLVYKGPTPCKRGARNASTTNTKKTGLVDALFAWLSLPVVHAQDCPSCVPEREECSGFWMWPQSLGCFQGCNGEYPKYYSMPGIAPGNRGWCYSGATICDPCGQCRETSCSH